MMIFAMLISTSLYSNALQRGIQNTRLLIDDYLAAELTDSNKLTDTNKLTDSNKITDTNKQSRVWWAWILNPLVDFSAAVN